MPDVPASLSLVIQKPVLQLRTFRAVSVFVRVAGMGMVVEVYIVEFDLVYVIAVRFELPQEPFLQIVGDTAGSLSVLIIIIIPRWIAGSMPYALAIAASCSFSAAEGGTMICGYGESSRS